MERERKEKRRKKKTIKKEKKKTRKNTKTNVVLLESYILPGLGVFFFSEV